MTIKSDALYSDLDLSFIPNPRTGDLTPKTNVEAIKRAAINVLHLERFDIPFSPSTYAGLREYLFSNLDRVTEVAIKSDIVSVLKKLEPRIKVQEVTVTSPSKGQLNINIKYSCLSLNRDGNFNFILEKVR